MITALYPYALGPILKIPFYSTTVPAGFPSPADDHLDQRLDLNELVIQHPAATFFVTVQGDSMTGAGIHTGDTLVVDRAVVPVDKQVVVAVVDGAFTVKRLRATHNRIVLVAEHPDIPPFEITAEMDFQIWGVVTFVIHKV